VDKIPFKLGDLQYKAYKPVQHGCRKGGATGARFLAIAGQSRPGLASLQQELFLQ